MPDGSLVFPAVEFRKRVKRLQRLMGIAGQDALLLTSAADVFYVTGFLTRFWESPARPWFVIVPLTGDPVAIIPAIGRDLMARTWISDIRTWDAPDPVDDGVSLLSAALGDLVRPAGAIGLPMGLETSLRMPLAGYHAIVAKLAPRRFVDATDTVQRVREIKSDTEIAKIRAICAVADRVFDRVPDFAGQGRPLDAVFRDFQIALLQEGADWVSYVAGGAGPGGFGDVISPADSRALTAGDVVMLDTGAVKDGYFCDFDRNFAVGHADAAAKKAHAALFAATDVALDVLRPGMTAQDAYQVIVNALQAQGAQPGAGRLGHGLGLTLTEWPSLSAHDTTELRAGMVLTLEPGVVIGRGRIMVQEENIVLTHDGPLLLHRRTPPELPVIG